MPAAAPTTDSFFDVWRKIPPEEKLELMARAQSRGLGAAVVLLTITGTVAAGLRLPWIFWGAFMGVPFIFQFASAKAWRDMKPRAMLEYLAARSAARRYAYGCQCKDLTVVLMFRGVLQRQFDEEEIQSALEARVESKDYIDVWVALFPDTVVMMSERSGGAKLEFAQSLGERLAIKAVDFDNQNDSKQLEFTVENKRGDKHSWVLTSSYPAALYVFERKAQAFTAEIAAQAERDRHAYADMFNQYSGENFND